MIPTLFFYQLVLIALVWLCLMCHWMWPSAPATCLPTPEPTHPVPKRKRERKPFAGLTTKPHCDACEHGPAPRPPAPSTPPPRIVPTRGRRRQVDTSTHFCPNPDCAYRGWVGWGNLRANGHPSGGPWRQLLCIVCRGYFLETLGTIFHGKRVAPELIVRVIACLAEDFLPFVKFNLSNFYPHLHDRLTATPGDIVAGTSTQHSYQDTQQPVPNIA
jgi:hypothetical protein